MIMSYLNWDMWMRIEFDNFQFVFNLTAIIWYCQVYWEYHHP